MVGLDPIDSPVEQRSEAGSKAGRRYALRTTVHAQLHREDMYERESPRAGEADLIVAKHRNGPTSAIVVSFEGHCSRFVEWPPARATRRALSHIRRKLI